MYTNIHTRCGINSCYLEGKTEKKNRRTRRDRLDVSLMKPVRLNCPVKKIMRACLPQSSFWDKWKSTRYFGVKGIGACTTHIFSCWQAFIHQFMWVLVNTFLLIFQKLYFVQIQTRSMALRQNSWTKMALGRGSFTFKKYASKKRGNPISGGLLHCQLYLSAVSCISAIDTTPCLKVLIIYPHTTDRLLWTW